MATRGKSSADMEWLSIWAEGLGKVAPGFEEYDLLAASHCASIRMLITEPSVLRRLTVAYEDAEARLGQLDASAAVKKFLVDASWICHWAFSAAKKSAPSGTTPSRSETVGELQALAKKVSALAKRLRSAAPDLGKALDIDYLRGRHHAGNPEGFIIERKGWKAAPQGAGVTVALYLDALAADILEEAELRQVAIVSRRQVGGKLAPHYPVIDLITMCSGRLSPSPDFALIADVINSLIKPNPPLDPDPLRKQYKAKQRRKLTPDGP